MSVDYDAETDLQRGADLNVLKTGISTTKEPKLKPSHVFQLTRSLELDLLREEWLALANSLENTSYFQTPDWVLSWWNTVGGQPFTLVATWRSESGGLDAIACLSRVHEWVDRRVKLAVPVWANTGSGPGKADHCGWLARRNRVSAVFDWLLRESSGGTLLLRSLDAEFCKDIGCAAQAVHRTTCPRLDIPSDGSKIGRSANFREQLRAKGRKLRKTGVVLKWVEPPDMQDHIVASLLSLHTACWRVKGALSSFTWDQIDLHRSLIKQGGAGRGPAAVVAEHRDQAIGVLYGFWWKDVFYYYQLGWNPDWAPYNLGTVLLHEAIEMARSGGAQVFDFLRGSELFKYRFGARDRIDSTFMVPRGLSGAMLTFAFFTRRLLRSIINREPPNRSTKNADEL